MTGGVLCISKNRDRTRLAAYGSCHGLGALSALNMAWTLLSHMNFGKNMFNLGFFNLIYRKSTP